MTSLTLISDGKCGCGQTAMYSDGKRKMCLRCAFLAPVPGAYGPGYQWQGHQSAPRHWCNERWAGRTGPWTCTTAAGHAGLHEAWYGIRGDSAPAFAWELTGDPPLWENGKWRL